MSDTHVQLLKLIGPQMPGPYPCDGAFQGHCPAAVVVAAVDGLVERVGGYVFLRYSPVTKDWTVEWYTKDRGTPAYCAPTLAEALLKTWRALEKEHG